MEYLWFVFALLSAITAALVAIFGKLGLEGIDANTATALRAVIMALFLVGVILVEGKLAKVSAVLTNSKALYYIILSGMAGALSWLFYFLALKTGDVSKVVPVDRLSVVFALVLAVFFLGEKVTLLEGIGMALVLGGIILIALK